MCICGHLYVTRSRHSQSWPPMAHPAIMLRSQHCRLTSAAQEATSRIIPLSSTTRFVHTVFFICEFANRLNYTTHHFSGFYHLPTSLAHYSWGSSVSCGVIQESPGDKGKANIGSKVLVTEENSSETQLPKNNSSDIDNIMSTSSPLQEGDPKYHNPEEEIEMIGLRT